MNEEEKKAIELLKAMIKNKPDTIRLERRKGIYALQLALNLIEKQQKELNNIKEIEKSHQEENGKLRVELEQEKERNKTKVDIKDIEFSNFIKERYVSKDKLKFVLSKLNISDIEPWSTYKIDGQILFDLQELL